MIHLCKHCIWPLNKNRKRKKHVFLAHVGLMCFISKRKAVCQKAFWNGNLLLFKQRWHVSKLSAACVQLSICSSRVRDEGSWTACWWSLASSKFGKLRLYQLFKMAVLIILFCLGCLQLMHELLCGHPCHVQLVLLINARLLFWPLRGFNSWLLTAGFEV